MKRYVFHRRRIVSFFGLEIRDRVRNENNKGKKLQKS